MAENIRSSIIFLLTIINFIGNFLIFSNLSNYKENSHYIKRKLQHNNLRINNLKISIKDEKLNSKGNIYNYTYFNESDFEISKKNKSNYTLKEKLNLRKLSNYNSSYYYAILLLNLIYLYFCFNLVSSFFIEDNECKKYCCGCEDCSGCDCTRSIDNAGGLIVVCFLIIGITMIIYFSTKFCGKHLARYISLTFIIIINILIFVLSLTFIYENQKGIKINIIISVILLICNVLGVSLPNLKRSNNLIYNYNQPENINYPSEQLPEINNENFIHNNNYNNFDNFNNSQNNTNENNNILIVESEHNNEFPLIQNNNSILQNSNISANHLNIQKSENNCDVEIAPLLRQDPPSES